MKLNYYSGIKVTTMSQYSRNAVKKHKKEKIDKRCFSCKKEDCKGKCEVFKGYENGILGDK